MSALTTLVNGLVDGLVDTRPLRSSAHFRRLWWGTTTSGLSGQVAVVAVLYQVWELTHDAARVGVVGLVSAVPTVVFGLLGGQLADAVDRRLLVMGTTAGAVVAAGLLAVQAALGAHSVALVLVLVAAQTACRALGSPARRTFIVRLLPSEQVPAGVALNHISFQVAMLVGPALAGLVLARGGLTACYILDASAITASVYGVTRLPALRPTGTATPVSWRATWDGWRFITGRPALRAAIASDLAATVLAMPVALFPVLDAERFEGDPATLGLLLSAVAVGGVAAGLASATMARARRPGILMLAAAAAWGAALAGFGAVHTLPATLACLALAGAADTISVIARGTVVQLATPDAYLGRVTSVENVVGVAGPGLGNARAGAVASLTSPALAAITGGLTCLVAVAALAATNPALRHWHHDDQHPPR